MDAPLDYFSQAAGPAARSTMVLGWVFTGICTAVCVIIAGLLILSMMRHRSAGGGIGGESGGVRWVAVASGISIAVLLGMAVYALADIANVAAPRIRPAFAIDVTGYDWWWRADYGDFQTANEIHIPTGVPVLMRLHSADVIHAFWVPRLAGKTQMIPGVENRQWLQADRPGVYRGQCTQFCGLQHAHMAFEVVAEPPADYARWRAAQVQGAALPSDAQAATGQALFVDRCGGCHTVRGTAAAGQHGPDLTHLMSRRQIAAGTLDTTPEHVMDWVQHVQALKPGARMPDFGLSPDEQAALKVYLAGLR